MNTPKTALRGAKKKPPHEALWITDQISTLEYQCATEEDSAPADESSASMVAVVTGAALAVTIVGTVMSL